MHWVVLFLLFSQLSPASGSGASAIETMCRAKLLKKAAESCLEDSAVAMVCALEWLDLESVPDVHPTDFAPFFAMSLGKNRMLVTGTKPIPGLDDEPIFYADPRFARRFELLTNNRGKLELDPSAFNIAFYHPFTRTIVVNPRASYQTFEHEFAHFAHHQLRDHAESSVFWEEFADLYRYVDRLKSETRFSEETLGEVFAVLHEQRFSKPDHKAPAATGESDYLTYYVDRDLKDVPWSQLSESEREWKNERSKAIRKATARDRFDRRVFWSLTAAAMTTPFLPFVYLQSAEWLSVEERNVLNGNWKAPICKLIDQILSAAGRDDLHATEIQTPRRLGAGFDGYFVNFTAAGRSGVERGHLAFRIAVDALGKRLEITEGYRMPFLLDSWAVLIDGRPGKWTIYRGSRNRNPIALPLEAAFIDLGEE